MNFHPPGLIFLRMRRHVSFGGPNRWMTREMGQRAGEINLALSPNFQEGDTKKTVRDHNSARESWVDRSHTAPHAHLLASKLFTTGIIRPIPLSTTMPPLRRTYACNESAGPYWIYSYFFQVNKFGLRVKSIAYGIWTRQDPRNMLTLYTDLSVWKLVRADSVNVNIIVKGLPISWIFLNYIYIYIYYISHPIEPPNYDWSASYTLLLSNWTIRWLQLIIRLT